MTIRIMPIIVMTTSDPRMCFYLYNLQIYSLMEHRGRYNHENLLFE